VPELASLPDDCIHTPWEASPHILEEAGIVLGETYPFPIVDHTVARDLAMKAYKHIRELRQ
jgi:deoxyribodipyrimidine photo-lyase